MADTSAPATDIAAEPLPEAERAMQEIDELRTFLTNVVAVQDIHPHLRQITFGGGDLATFSPAGPDTFLYVLLPPPGRRELTIDQSFSWEAHAPIVDNFRVGGDYISGDVRVLPGDH